MPHDWTAQDLELERIRREKEQRQAWNPWSLNPDLIKQLRLALGLTQGEFATQVGITRQTVWLWEVGRTVPRMPRVINRLNDLSRLAPKKKEVTEDVTIK